MFRPAVDFLPQTSMKAHRSVHHFLRSRSGISATTFILLAGAAAAAEVTWDGQIVGATALSTALNWAGDVAPVSGDSLRFPAMGNPVTTTGGLFANTAVYGANNDLAAGAVFSGITFDTTWGGNSFTGNAFVLSGDLIDNQPLFTQSFNTPIALAGTRTVNVSARTGAVAISGAISDSTAGSGLTKIGPGVLVLTGTNTFTGPVSVTGGTYSMGDDARLGALPAAATPGSIVLDGGSLRVTFGLTIGMNRGTTLGAGGGTFDTAAATLYRGVIAGSGALVKTGASSLTLGGASTYSGSTTLNHGTLKLDFSQAAAPASNILPSTSSLVLNGLSTAYNAATSTTAGSTLNVTSGSGVSNVQAFASTTVNGGQQTISTTSTASGNVLLNLGAVSHSGGTVNFALAGALAAGNAITTTTANDASGILGGWATYKSADYAANDGAGNIVAYAGYTVVNSGLISSLAATNVRSLTNGALALSVADAVTTNINTYSIGNATTGVKTLTIGSSGSGSTGVLRLGAEGGLMIGSGAGGIVVGDTVGNGKLTAGGADNTAGSIHFINHSASDSFTVNSAIANNGTGAVSVRVSGYGVLSNASTLTLNGINTYTGGTVIYGGRVTAGTTSAFGTGTVTVRNGAQASLATAGTYANDFNIAGSGTSTADNASALYFQGNAVVSGKVTLQGDATVTPRNTTGNFISGQITGGYGLSLTAATGSGGDLTLSNPANNWTGNLLIDSQTLKLGASQVIPNGTGAGSVILGTAATSILDLNGFNETINGLAANGTGGFVQNSAVGTTSTLTLGDGNVTSRFEGIIRDNAGTGGTVALVKVGSGTIHLPSSNTFTGGLTVKAGVAYGSVGTSTGTPFGASTGTITLGDTSGSASATLRQNTTSKSLAHPFVVVAGSTGEKVIDCQGLAQTYTYTGAMTLNDSLSIKTYTGGTNIITTTGTITGVGAVNLVVSSSGGAINMNGVLAGANTGLIANGSNYVYLPGQSTFGGNVVVNGGTVQAAALAPNNGTTGSLGNSTIAGRTVTVNSGATLLLTSNNIFGNGSVAPASLPAIIVNGGTVRANRYSTIGRLDLSNGATLTNTSSDSATFQSAMFRNNVNVTGTSPSTITATAISATLGGYHLAGNTTFTVDDVTASAATDLNVVAPLRDQSGDFSSQSGGLTKAGAGTMTLGAANTYSGATAVNAGTLIVNGSLGSGAVTIAASATLGGSGTLGGNLTSAGRIAPGGVGTGTLAAARATISGTLAVRLDGGASDKLMVNGDLDLTGSTLDLSVLGGGVTAATYVIGEYTGTLTGTFASVPAGYTVNYAGGVTGKQIVLGTQVSAAYGDWATANGLDGTNNGVNQDPDHDGIPNLLEFILGGNPLAWSTDVLPTYQIGDDTFTAYFLRNTAATGNVTLVAQWTTDMSLWHDLPVGAESALDGSVTVTPMTMQQDLITVTIPRSNEVNGKLFLRLKATP